LACVLSCTRPDSPQAAFEHAVLTFQHGDLIRSQREAADGYKRFLGSDREWAWRFKILEAKTALWRGMYEDALRLLGTQPGPPEQASLTIAILAVESLAHARLHHFPEAMECLRQSERLCLGSPDPSCGEVMQSHGLLAYEQNQFLESHQFLDRSLFFARSRGDRFLEATSLLNSGAVFLKEEHFDQAITASQASFEIATSMGAGDVALVAQDNVGWAYYKFGDYEGSLKVFQEAVKHSAQLGDVFDQENELTNIGYIYLDERKFDLAAESFRQALGLAQGIKAKGDIYNAQRVLARLALQTGDLEQAGQYAQQALQIAREGTNHLDELYPLLVQGQIAARRGGIAGAKQTFEAVKQDKISPVFLKWEAQHSLAQLYESNNQVESADREYREALATFEAARADVKHEDFHLSFLTNGWHIYDDYIHFLAARNQANDALRWADNSRARTLAEGLGLLAKGAPSGPGSLNAMEIARRAKGTLLFYWLGEKQSYLWAITSRKTTLFPLPPGPEIDAAVQRYRKALGGPQDVLQSADTDGRSLYRMLIEPAQSLLAQNAKVFIIPDGSLNNLNFETLLVPEPALHFWIEDVTIANASSLRVLGASHTSKERGDRSLLLIGDSVAPSPKYPELARAAAQMASVARHFSGAPQRIFTRELATPAAYLASSPEHFSYIHFVAHGTASRLSPLDSAIVLSKESANSDSFKLYARDIVRHPLRADLVTISACYSVGERWYSGEGLVGLSWAFLRAGAHNVIAALWEAEDISTMLLMDMFYAELDKGSSPDAALRVAKLSLLRGSAFRNPFYWAPFQLYGGQSPVARCSAHARPGATKGPSTGIDRRR
jgi:CHAT domain-containing protein